MVPQPIPAPARGSRGLWALVGLSGGLLLGVVYLGVLHWMGVSVTLRGQDVTVPFLTFLSVSFGILGYLIGRQAARAAHHQDEAARSRARRLHLEAAHAHDIQAARLDSLGRLALAAAQDLRERLDALEADGRDPRVQRLVRWCAAMEAYGQPVQPELAVADLSALVGRAVTRAGDALSGRHLHLDERPPEVARQLRVDPALLEPVIEELLRNAGEATDHDGQIHIRAGTQAGYAWLEVADDGPGVPPDARIQLFEPFQTSREGRTGLGLATSARVVEALGGRLSYQHGRGLAEGGGGACFRLSLPAHGAPAKAARQPAG